VGAIKELANGEDVNATPANLAPRLEAMGQQLYAPPNVKGWVGGHAWLNTATMLVRLNFIESLLSESLARAPQAPDPITGEVPEAPRRKAGAAFTPDQSADPVRLVQGENANEPDAIVRVLVDAHLQGDISDAARASLKDFMADGNPSGPDWEQRVRETCHAIMTMPEYQLA
jgi:hypothetical protein